MLLDGPPGTGKDSKVVVADFVRHLRPDVVVIDDIDRMDTDTSLEAVDAILADGCAVLASSNDLSKVCDALLRSGRIDLHHEFGACEADLFERLTTKLSPAPREGGAVRSRGYDSPSTAS